MGECVVSIRVGDRVVGSAEVGGAILGLIGEDCVVIKDVPLFNSSVIDRAEVGDVVKVDSDVVELSGDFTVDGMTVAKYRLERNITTCTIEIELYASMMYL